MLHPAAARTLAPCGTSTRLIASPSGMLWIAIAIVTTTPNSLPPPNAAPMPAPSANEWTVITATRRIPRRALAPCSTPKETAGRPASSRRATPTNAAPTAAPSGRPPGAGLDRPRAAG